MLRIACLALLTGLILALSYCPAVASSYVPEQLFAQIDSLWSSGQGDAAQSAVKQSLPLVRAEHDSTTLMVLLIKQGQMYAAMGSGGAADPVLQEGLLLARALNDSLKICSALRWLGVSRNIQGHIDSTKKLFQEQKQIAAIKAYGVLEGWAEVGLGYVAQEQGSLKVAMLSYKRAIDLFNKSKHLRGELWALNNCGNVLNLQGRLSDASDCYRRSLEIGQQEGFVFVEAMAENNLGTIAYNLGEPEKGLAHFSRASNLHKQTGNLHEQVLVARNISLCQVRLGFYADAMDQLTVLSDHCRVEGYRAQELRVQTLSATVLRGQGQLAKAAALQRDLLSRSDVIGPGETAELHVELARTLALQDSSQVALNLLIKHEASCLHSAGVDIRLNYAVELGRLFLEANLPHKALAQLRPVVSEARSLKMDDISLMALPLVGATWLALDQPDSAICYYEDAVKVWTAERDKPADPQWRERMGLVSADIFTQLAALKLDAPLPKNVGNREAQVFEVLQSYKAITLLERMIGPEPGRWPKAQLVSLPELQGQVLKPGELLLDYYLGTDLSLLLAVTHNKIQIIKLPARKKLASQVELYLSLVSRAPAESLGQNLGQNLDQNRRQVQALGIQSLRQILLDPVIDLVNNSQVIYFSPDGALNSLPPSLLLLSKTNKPVYCIPSASILTSLKASIESDTIQGTCLSVLGPGTESRDTNLLGAEQETEYLVEKFGAQPLNPSRDDSVLSNMQQCDILHFATHCRVFNQAPWRSGIEFNGISENISENLVLLTAAEIAEQDIGASMVVLSGCESARGTIVTGEGVLGLGSAFLSAGVPTVIATLWDVDDAVAAGFMRYFYDRLSDGLTITASFAAAKKHLQDNPATADPFYWGGYVIIGAGDQVFNLPSTSGFVLKTDKLLKGSVIILLLLILSSLLLRKRML